MISPTRTTIEQAGNIAIMRFEGDIMSLSEPAVLGTYRGLDPATTIVLLDFSRVPYLNSSGIALVIQLMIAARKVSRKVACFGLSPHFIKVFRMLGLADYTALYKDEADARAAVAG
jgi:anti-sigma B factor antagonist